MAASVHPSINYPLLRWNFVSVFVFIYFLTLSMDLISIDVGFFKLKLSHAVSSAMFVFLFFFRKSLFFEKKLFYCFLWILSSMLISSFNSVVFLRSFAYGIVCVFTFLVYFIVPLSLMYYGDEKKNLKFYLASFFAIGTYAFLQFFSSLFGVELPYSTQKLISIIRGSGFSHEPSFYALYAIPFVVFLNTKSLITKACNDQLLQTHKERGFDQRKFKRFLVLFIANVFLLVSTSTTAFLAYITLFFVLLFFKNFSSLKDCFFGLGKKLLRVSLLFLGLFSFVGLMFPELLKSTFLKFFFYGFQHDSFKDRLAGIINSLKIFCDHPFIGVGLGGIGPLNFQEKIGAETIMELDRYEIQTLEPTNVLSEVLGCLGVLGFVGFSLLLIVVWKQFRKVLDDHRLILEERINILAFLISIIVGLVCIQVNQGLFRSYFWVHMGIGIGYLLKIKTKIESRHPI